MTPKNPFADPEHPIDYNIRGKDVPEKEIEKPKQPEVKFAPDPRGLDEIIGKGIEIKDGIYTDGYIKVIEEFYPAKKALGTRMEGIKQGKDDMCIFTGGTPLQKAEAESVLRRILYRTAHAGIWQPEIIEVEKLTHTHIRTADEYLQAIRDSSPVHMHIPHGGIQFGISVAARENFVAVIKYQNNVIVLPMLTFIEYCIQKNNLK